MPIMTSLCAQLIHEYLDDKEYLGVVRASMSMFTTTDEVDALCGALGEI
jgi:selenocysteine lyase/cysteine desulfurase